MPIADDLAKLAALRRSGDLTDEQYRLASNAVLNEYSASQPEEPGPEEPFSLAPPPPPKKAKRKLFGLGFRGWAVLALIVFVIASVSNYESTAEKMEKLRTSDPVAYASLIAKQEADAAAKAETDRVAAQRRQEEQLAAANRQEKEQAEAAVADREREIAAAAEKAEETRKGFHCLSGWDGSHKGIVDWVKENANDPGSFEHDETRISAVNDNGQHGVIMQYRAKNGFGGMVRGTVVATIRNSDCALVEVTSSS